MHILVTVFRVPRFLLFPMSNFSIALLKNISMHSGAQRCLYKRYEFYSLQGQKCPHYP
jgi:hypothetical protein